MSNNKKTGRGMFGGAYYIALALCAVAIAVTGFVYYRSADKAEPAIQDNQLQATLPVAILEEDFTVGVTLPEKTEPQQTQAPTQAPGRTMKTGAPLEGDTVAGYAMDCLSYNETTRDWRVHNGVDIAAEAGAPVMAAAAGQVYTVYEDELLGHTVVIRHEDGYVTTYSSLAPEISVSAGDTVALGEAIGTVGDTALIETAMGPHLHFSVLRNDIAVDPDEFLSLGS